MAELVATWSRPGARGETEYRLIHSTIDQTSTYFLERRSEDMLGAVRWDLALAWSSTESSAQSQVLLMLADLLKESRASLV